MMYVGTVGGRGKLTELSVHIHVAQLENPIFGNSCYFGRLCVGL